MKVRFLPGALSEPRRTAKPDLGLAGRPDDDVVEAATSDDRVLLTENVADFARIAADRVTAGKRHSGILIALSSRFSRRPSGRPTIVAAVTGVRSEQMADRVVHLER